MLKNVLTSMILFLVIEITLQYCEENVFEETIDKLPQCGIYDDFYECGLPDRYERKIINKTITCYGDTLEQLYSNLESQDYPVEIIVKNSNLGVLTPISSQKTRKITKLQFINVNISKIIPGYFNHIHNLTTLELQENSLTELTDGVFTSLNSLKSINLSGNRIERLGQHSFSGTVSLTHVDLSNNKIVTLPDGVFEYDLELQELNLSNNQIKDIGKIFGSSVNIKNIYLSHNQLDEIDFNHFPLDLNNLDLSWNQITRLQNVNFYFRSITNFSISNNKLGILFKFGNVSSLNASSNSIQELSENILSEQLNVLDLSNNSLTQISAKAFKNLTKLQFLYMHHNNLSDLPIAGFRDLTDLQYLDLSHNHLFQLQYGLLGNCKSLNYLDISNNNLNFEFESLTTLSELKEFRFANNNFKNIDVNIMLQHFPKLKTVSLLNNFWKCKELAYFVNVFKANKISVVQGNDYDQNNVLGISCNIDNEIKANQVVVLNRSETQSQNISENALIKYLDNNFKNTNFYKYMESLKLSQNNTVYKSSVIKYFENDFKNSSFYKYLEGFKQQNENITEVLKTLYMKFLNDDFKTTTFYQYMQSLQSQKNQTQSEDFYRNSMVKYFDIDFKNSNFYKYLENFRQTNVNTTRISPTFLSKFLNEKATEEKYGNGLTDSVLTYIETDFKNTSFYKLLEKTASLATFRENIYDTSNKSESAKLEGIMEKNNYSSNGSNIFNVVSCILLLCIVCLLLYQVLIQKKGLPNTRNEPVELSSVNLISEKTND